MPSLGVNTVVECALAGLVFLICAFLSQINGNPGHLLRLVHLRVLPAVTFPLVLLRPAPLGTRAGTSKLQLLCSRGPNAF